MKILVTGAAGFIGFHTTLKLAKEGHTVIGIDSLNDYYERSLKNDRLKVIGIDVNAVAEETKVTSTVYPNCSFQKLDITNKLGIMSLFQNEHFDYVIHLAAQAGVRYSITNPEVYLKSNIDGFLCILEACRKYPVAHLIYASSSSVYGNSETIPFSVGNKVDRPVSIYATTKKSNELMAHTYSHLFNIPTTGLRFFTVYGPWGRPDMAPSLFANAILEGNPIKVFNHGNMERDFTYVNDIVKGIIGIMPIPPQQYVDDDVAYAIHNIGNSNPIRLMDFITTIEKHLGKKAVKEMLPMQAGDVRTTYADVSSLAAVTGYNPNTSLDEGVKHFINWLVAYKSNSQFQKTTI